MAPPVVHRIAVGALIAALAWPAGQPALRWEVLQDYGAEEPPANAALGGPALAQIVAVRPFSDGRIAILDRKYGKVALFAKNGRFLRTIGLGLGSGPGEFRLPIALDVSDDRVGVFDYEGNRVTVFDTLGKVLWSRATPSRAKKIIVVGDTVYGSYMPGRQFLVWRQGSDDVSSVARLIPVEPKFLQEQNSRGLVGMLGRGAKGEILVAHERPGLWFVIDHSGVSPVKGTDLLGNARPLPFEDMVIPPGQTLEIFALSDNYVAIAYTARQEDARHTLAIQDLAIFDRVRGTLAGKVDIKGGEQFVAAIGPGPGPFEVLVAREEPFPHVVKMVLRGLK